jgi:hypothetical protein
MKLFHLLELRLLLLAILFLPGCATSRKPTTAPPIPSYGGTKRVVVSLTEQKLHAYDGDQLVFETHVSTGHEPKFTPTGNFRALSKEIIHYSSLYQNSPMPFSVRFDGNFYLHGYYVVPDYPASHGCIRLPLRDANNFNPAQQFYEWVRVGTRVQVTGRWEGPLAASVQNSPIQRWFKTRSSPAPAATDTTIYWRQ